jgi:glutaredoxin-related protein
MQYQGHSPLDHICSVDATALTRSIEKHARTPPVKHLSKTSQAPALVSDYSVTDEKQETPEQLDKRLRNFMNQSKVVLFMKGTRDVPRCGFSRSMVTLLKGRKMESYTTIDILTDDSARQGEPMVYANSNCMNLLMILLLVTIRLEKTERLANVPVCWRFGSH